MRVAVMGAGSWGTALALALAGDKTAVRLWVRSTETYKSILLKRANDTYLPGLKIPEQIRPTTSLAEALHGAELVLLAVPSGGLRELAAAIRGKLPSRALVVNAAKGLEGRTGMRLSQVLEQELTACRERIAVISGPNHAVEVARGFPTVTVVAAGNLELAREIGEMLTRPALRVYTSGDLAGVEMGGALAGMFALGAGMLEGLGLGENARAILVTGGFKEMVRLGEALGGGRETFSGLTGLGDLFAGCCSSIPSRNREAGIMLARGRLPAEMAPGSKAVAEGVPTARAVWELAEKHRLAMPITGEICAVLFQGKSPREAAEAIIQRGR